MNDDPLHEWLYPVMMLLVSMTIIGIAWAVIEFAWFEPWFAWVKEGLAVVGVLALVFLADLLR